MFILIVALALLFVMPPPVDAGEKASDTTKSETRLAAPLPSDEQLDALVFVQPIPMGPRQRAKRQ